MNLALENLRDSVTVADGGWSTILQSRGFAEFKPAELANLESPELVIRLARDYVEAGATILTTNTFAANRFHWLRRKATGALHDVNRRGVEIALEARGSAAVTVLGAMGPSGRLLAIQEVTREELTDAFAAQARDLVAAGVEGIALETFSELEELLAAVAAVREVTTLPIIASMSFDSGPQRTRTAMGAAADNCAAALDEAGVDVVGCNCGAGIATVLPAVVAMRSRTRKPLWVKPSAALPDLQEGRAVYPVDVDDFMSHIAALLDAGVNIIGGCCGVGPEHIRRLSLLVQNRAKHANRR